MKERIVLIVAGVVLIVILLNLPKVVVDNKEESMAPEEKAPSAETSKPTDIHLGKEAPRELQPEEEDQVNSLRKKVNSKQLSEKSVIFADSLARMFWEAANYDSASHYYNLIASYDPSPSNLRQAGDAFYEAFSIADDAEKASRLGQKARDYYNKVLDRTGADIPGLQTKIAMTLVAGDNPMQGVMKLREVLEKHPNNQVALYNMGILSIQSGQYEKAVERFTTLLEQDSTHVQGHFYLALSYQQLGDKDQAIQHFEKVKTLDSDPSVKATVDGYLQELD